jgi:transcriptional regulator with XRE-family HTH domain
MLNTGNHFHKNVSEWIKRLREAAGLSIEDASRRVSVSQANLEAFESGESIPLEALTRICAGYGVNSDDIQNKLIELQKSIKLD